MEKLLILSLSYDYHRAVTKLRKTHRTFVSKHVSYLLNKAYSIGKKIDKTSGFKVIKRHHLTKELESAIAELMAVFRAIKSI